MDILEMEIISDDETFDSEINFQGEFINTGSKEQITEAIKEYVATELENATKDKVDKVEGKGLSTNDFTDEEKEKLANLSESGGNDIDLSTKMDKFGTVTKDEVNKKISVKPEYDNETFRNYDLSIGRSDCGISFDKNAKTEITGFSGIRLRSNSGATNMVLNGALKLYGITEDYDVKVTGVANPTSDNDAVNKKYVDDVFANIEIPEGGKDEIYVGSGDMPKGCVLQIDPEGSGYELPTGWQTLVDITLDETTANVDRIQYNFDTLEGFSEFAFTIDIPATEIEETNKTITVTLRRDEIGSMPIYSETISTTSSRWIGNAFIVNNGSYSVAYCVPFARHLGLNSSPTIKARVNINNQNAIGKNCYLLVGGGGMNFPVGTRVVFGGRI